MIVPLAGRGRGLDRTVDALLRQTYPADRNEVIVVDNGADAGTLAYLRRLERIKLVSEPRPGSYAARNAGVAASRGAILAFTDADCIPDPDWLQAGVTCLVSEPGAGFAAGRIAVSFVDPGAPTAVELLDAAFSYNQEDWVAMEGYGATANLFTTRPVIDAVGAFDPELRSGGDCEWGHRVSQAGYRGVFCPAAVVVHPARRSLRDLIRRSLRVTVGTMRTLEKHNRRAMGAWEYVLHHAWSRPAELTAKARRLAGKRRSLVLPAALSYYYLIKSLQVLERLRVRLGGTPRR